MSRISIGGREKCPGPKVTSFFSPPFPFLFFLFLLFLSTCFSLFLILQRKEEVSKGEKEGERETRREEEKKEGRKKGNYGVRGDGKNG